MTRATGTLTRVSSLSLVRYRTNDYSVPVAYGHREVLVRGYVDEVVVSCGTDVIARHRRSYDRDDFVFDPIHYLPLLERKTGALDQAAPLAGWDLPEEFGTLRRLLESRMGRRGKSNCLKSQEVRPSTCGLRSHQGERCLSMELRITSSLRMQAVRATFFGFPAVNSRW